MSAQAFALAYHPENRGEAQQILSDFQSTGMSILEIAPSDYNEPSIFDQLVDFDGPILLLLSKNFLLSLASMQKALSLISAKESQVIPVLVSGLQPEEGTGLMVSVPTQISKIGDIIVYINYWQNQYLSSRSHRNDHTKNDTEQTAFEHYTHVLRQVSSEAGEFLRHIKRLEPIPLEEMRLQSNKYAALQDKLPHFSFRDDLFLEDPIPQEIPETSPYFDHASYQQAITQEPYRVFEEEEIEVIEADGKNDQALENPFDFGNASQDSLPSESALIESSPLEEPFDNLEPLPLLAEESPEPSPSPTYEMPSLPVEHSQAEEPKLSPGTSRDAAISLLNQVSNQYPEDGDRQYFHLKLVLRETSDPKEQIRLLQDFRLKNRNNQEVTYELTERLKKQERWEEVKTIYEEFLLQSPRSAKILYELASLFITRFPDKIDRAGFLLTQCMEQVDYPKEVLYTYAIYLQSIANNPYKAVEYLLKTIEHFPNHPFAYYDIATFYFQEGERKIAREFYERAIQNNPELKVPANDLAFGGNNENGPFTE